MSNKGCSYAIGYVIGFLFVKMFKLLIFIVKGICKLFWMGTVEASMRFKKLIYVYSGLSVMTVLSLLIFGNCGIMIFIILLTILVNGIVAYMKDEPIREKREFFNSVFSTMDFKADDETFPYFLSETPISEYVTMFSFNTLIVLKSWLNVKDSLEMYLNVKIINIKQDEKNNRIINLFVQTAPLPERIEWTDYYMNEKNVLNIGIGYNGIVGMDLEKYPHAFIAGETGSGKSNILKHMIHQALTKEYDVILIDFKRGVSFSTFSDEVPVYYDYKEVMKVLKGLVNETINRLDCFRKTKVDNINDYNAFNNGFLKRKIVFIDELAELLKTTDKEISNLIYESIVTLTRLSRAVGIHLIMGIQRPDSTIISGQIKNNVSYRVCGRFVDKEPSRIMLSNDMASDLPNIKGRFIIKDDDIHEIQSFYFLNNYKYEKAKKEPLHIIEPNIEEIKTDMDDSIVSNSSVEKSSSEIPFEFDFTDFKG